MTDSAARRPRIAVVGAGIGGAAAAHALRQRLPDADVVVLEASDRVGGKLHRVELAGVTTDVGAEAMLARRPEALELARAVGLSGLLTHPATTRASLWTRGALRPLPRTVLGVPTDLPELERSGIVSGPGLERARESDGGPLDGDVSVGAFVTSRLGEEIADRLVEPLLGGVYAGHARSLSLRAAAPQIAALAERGGSLVGAAAESLRAAAAGPDRGPLFAGLDGGVGALVPAALAASGAEVRLRTTVRALERTATGWRLVTGPTTDERPLDVDAVVLGAPGPASARLLSGHAEVAARELAEVEYASMAIVSLAVPAEAIGGPPGGSGFLVPPVDGRTVKAATISSRKWGWLSERVGAGTVVLRASIGRAGETAVLQRTDDELVALAVADLREAVGLHAPPVDAHVQRWGGALPQYAVGHLDRVRRIEESVAGVPGLAVCGAAYHGVGIPAVIATARAAADRVAGRLASTRPEGE